MNIFRETFEKSRVTRKSIFIENKHSESDEDPKFVVEYDFQNISKTGEPLITQHVKDTVFADTVEEAEKLFEKFIENSKKYDSRYVSIGKPVFLGNSLITTEPYRIYTDGKIIKDIKLESDKSFVAESSSVELQWEERSDRRRVSRFKLRGCEAEIEEHKAIDGLHYYLYVEDEDLDEILCNGREFGSAEAAVEYAYEITAAPDPSSESKDFDPNKGNVATFLDEIETKIKEAVHEFMMKFEDEEVYDYCSVSANLVGEHIEVAVGAEISYSSLEDLCTALNKVIAKYDDNAYFEPECPGRIVAYLM